MIDPSTVALIMLGILVMAIMIGFPVAFTLMALGVMFGYWAYFQPDQAFFDNRVFYLLTQNTFTTMNSDVLVAVPLFLLMGYMVERSNLLDNLFHSVQLALRRILASPQFLIRAEQEPAEVAAGASYRISDLELASRLSFFLWSSLPDDELVEIAAQGRLGEPAVLEQQVRRMLADPRSASLVENFGRQWLYLRNLATTAPAQTEFPDWDDELRSSFARETELLPFHAGLIVAAGIGFSRLIDWARLVRAAPGQVGGEQPGGDLGRKEHARQAGPREATAWKRFTAGIGYIRHQPIILGAISLEQRTSLLQDALVKSPGSHAAKADNLRQEICDIGAAMKSPTRGSHRRGLVGGNCHLIERPEGVEDLIERDIADGVLFQTKVSGSHETANAKSVTARQIEHGLNVQRTLRAFEFLVRHRESDCTRIENVRMRDDNP